MLTLDTLPSYGWTDIYITDWSRWSNDEMVSCDLEELITAVAELIEWHETVERKIKKI